MKVNAVEGLIVLGILFVYFVPSIVATNREHHNTEAIIALNLFLGWTFLGWVISLVWALTAVNKGSEHGDTSKGHDDRHGVIVLTEAKRIGNDEAFTDITGSVAKVFLAVGLLIIFIWVVKSIIYPNGLAAPGRFDPGIQRSELAPVCRVSRA
jgi:Superinfection immunity protein